MKATGEGNSDGQRVTGNEQGRRVRAMGKSNCEAAMEVERVQRRESAILMAMAASLFVGFDEGVGFKEGLFLGLEWI